MAVALSCQICGNLLHSSRYQNNTQMQHTLKDFKNGTYNTAISWRDASSQFYILYSICSLGGVPYQAPSLSQVKENVLNFQILFM